MQYLTYICVKTEKMVQSKSELFENEIKVSASFFKVLAHPARLQILQFLAESKSCITGDISDELPLGRTTVNQHIKELKEIGLIQGNISGVTTRYCLNPDKIDEMKKALLVFFEKIDTQNYTCE